MRLAIADPPYLGRGELLYGVQSVAYPARMGRSGRRIPVGDAHADAAVWDQTDSHRLLVERLVADYDGWAIAMNPENLFDYLAWVPRSARVCAWIKRDPFPAGHVVKSWEPVIVEIPARARPRDMQARDSLYSGKSRDFIGAKPAAWTRWVLDMLGYDPEQDTVDDLFPGSGSVTAAINQGTLL